MVWERKNKKETETRRISLEGPNAEMSKQVSENMNICKKCPSLT